METTKITGNPVTVRLSKAYGKVVHEKYARALWTLYVNPQDVPSSARLRRDGDVRRPGRPHAFCATTNVSWPLSTAANKARALVVIPPGYDPVSSLDNM